jgi:hypothetical protein
MNLGSGAFAGRIDLQLPMSEKKKWQAQRGAPLDD